MTRFPISTPRTGRLRALLRPTRVDTSPAATSGVESDRWWWPWDSDHFDEPAPNEATVSLDALRRRITLGGDFSGRPALALLDRVFDLLVAIRPGPSSIDLSAVAAVDVQVVRWLTDARRRLAAFGATLTVIRAAPVSALPSNRDFRRGD